MQDEDALPLCGLDGGAETEAPSRREINHFARRINVFHLRPIKTQVGCISKKLDEHCKEDAAMKNQLKGARWALMFIGSALVALIPFLWQILSALQVLLKAPR